MAAIIKSLAKTNRLLLLGLAAEALYLLFFAVEPLKKIAGDQAASLTHNTVFAAVIAALIIQTGIYIAASRSFFPDSGRIRYLAWFVVVFNLTLLFVWPIGSVDILTYIHRCRLLTHFGENPYLVAYSQFAGLDPLAPMIDTVWSFRPMTYGPLFTYFGSVLTFLAGNNALAAVFLIKGAIIGLNILNFFMLRRGFGERAAFLYGWNPLVLFEFGINGHNDALMIFFLLLGFTLWQSGNPLATRLAAWIALIFSALVKYLTVVALPFFFLAALTGGKSAKNKMLVGAVFALVAVLAAALAWLPFYEPGALVPLGERLAAPADYFPSPGLQTAAALYLYFRAGQPLAMADLTVKILYAAVYLGFLVYFIRRSPPGGFRLAYGLSGLAVGVLLFGVAGWLMPWYFTVLIAYLAGAAVLTGEKTPSRLIYALTVYGILYYVILR